MLQKIIYHRPQRRTYTYTAKLTLTPNNKVNLPLNASIYSQRLLHSGSRRQAPSVVDGGSYRDRTDGNIKRVKDGAGVSPKWDICIACPAPKAQRSFQKRRCKDCKNLTEWKTVVKQCFLDPRRLLHT